MKKIFNFLFTIILLIFSFYYANIVKNFLKNKDPLMQEIKSNQDKYYKEPINAIITNKTIIPGISGTKLNINASYQKLKKIKKFDPSSLIIDKVKPSISLTNNIDKYIINGNLNKKNISIIISTNNLEIVKYYENTNISFIINKYFLLDNLNYLNSITNNIIIYQGNLNKNKRINYCYETNINNLNICSYYNLYTITPNIITHDYYYNVYNTLENGKIFMFYLNSNLDEFNILLKSISNLNYNLVSIDKLIEE